MMTKKNLVRIALPGLAVLIAANASLFAQKRIIKSTTTVTVQVPLKEAYELLIQLERFLEWSPFVVTDPNQRNFVTGTNGKVGSAFHWEGVDEKSKGKQTLSEANTNSFLRMDCEIEKPFKGESVFEYTLTDSNNYVIVEQKFTLPLNRFAYVMTKLFGVEKKMKEVNSLGMNRFKKLLEEEYLLSNH